MAAKKDEENSVVGIKHQDKVQKDEKKINDLVVKVHKEIDAEMEGRPYLFVLVSLHEIDREGIESKVAAQLNWRCNIDTRTAGRLPSEIETSKKLAKFLAEQVERASNDPENGIKKKYSIE